MNLGKTKIINTCDKIILFLLYAIAYFLPISKAIIESATIIAILFYLTKKLLEWQDIPKTHINIPIFSYLSICIVSMFMSSNPEISVKTFFAKILEYFSFFFVVADTLNSERRLKTVLFILLISSTVVGADGIFQYFTHKDFLRNRPYLDLGGRIYGPLTTPNDLGCYLASVLPFAIAFSFYKFRSILRRSFFILLSLLLFICLVLTVSKGAWYGFLALVIFMSLWIRPLMLFFLAAILFITVTKQYYILVLKNRLNQFFLFDTYGISDSGSIDRRMMWQAAWKMFISCPWIGVGLGTFMFNFKRFATDKYPFSIPYAHNCYLQMASEIGIFGLLAFLLILILFFYHGIKILNTRQRTFCWYVLLGSLAAILSYSVQMFVDTSFYSLDLGTLFWLILGLGSAVIKILESESEQNIATA